MTLDKRTPMEQLTEFIKQHPGEWYPFERPHAFVLPPEERLGGYVLIVNHVHASLFVDADGVLQVSTSLSWRGDHAPHLGIAGREAATLVNRIAIRVADSMQIFGGTCDTLPSWLRESVRLQLINRANGLLTLSGAPTTSPEVSPDSQAIEQARAAVIELTAYEALGLAKLPGLEDLCRILGVTI